MLSGHVMTLANSIIGVGILAMPFCFQKCGIILSVVLLIVSNWITRICCHYLIKCSLLTRRKSFEFLGFQAFGTSGKLLVELFIIGYLLGTCITYFVVVGDLGPQIVTKMFSLESGHLHLRTLIMVAVTLVCILPLGMLKNVDSLSTVFTASIGFYVCLVLKIVFESEQHIISNDWTQKVLYWEPSGVLQCLPIFSMALSCQMQLFEVFQNVNNQSVEKLNGIVRNATWICTCVYIAVGFFGYVAFCTQAFSGNILMSFSPSFGSDVIKIGFILSVAFSFPLVIFPCRASIYSLLYRKGHTDATGYIPETRFKVITVFIVSFALGIALLIPSVELIIGLVGSTIGVAICIMFPASCYRKIVKKETTERTLAQFILISGFCLMILGTYANLNAIDEKTSGAHIEVPNVEENLMRPSGIPDLFHMETWETLKDLENEQQKTDDSKLKNIILKSDDLNKLAKDLNLEKPKELMPAAEIVKSVQKPPPPLPVDEKHNEPPGAAVKLEDVKETNVENVGKTKVENVGEANMVKVKNVEENLAGKLQAISPIPDRVVIVPLVVDEPEKKIIAPPKTSNATIGEPPIHKNGTSQQSINKDAIKKDEDIAAEEQKLNKEAKSNDDELKKTQNELKETKELLERTVDELKEELAKQNKETQNMVVEKLGEVVEKVEQIERKVQKQESPPAVAPAETVKNAQEEPKRMNKGSLLSILAETGNAEEKSKPAVYEPLSYKTGELIEQAKHGNKIEQRLPLPLALLINASQIKVNENTVSVKTKETLVDNAEPLKNIPSLPSLSANDLPHENHVEAEEKQLKEDIKVNKLPESDKENVEAIRRDILQIDAKRLQSLGSSFPSVLPDEAAALPRVKRDSEVSKTRLNLEAINTKQEKENCLTEPKIDTLLAHSLSNAVDMKMQGIGRDLKAVREED